MACCGPNSCFSKTLVFVAQLVLVFSCLSAIFAQIYWLILATDSEHKHHADITINPTYKGYIARGLLLGIALIGLYATYTRELRHLKFFALALAFLSALSGLQAYESYATAESEDFRTKLELEHLLPKYEWYKGKPDQVTALWDDIQQSLVCCGVSSPDDWAKVRPSSVKKDILPVSCCPDVALVDPSKPSCRASLAYKTGCRARFVELQERYVFIKLIDVFYYLSLAILALSIAKPALPGVMRGFYTRPNSANHYARFDGSVYVRRPAGPGQGGYNEKPPSYVVATAPPPNYGMA